MSEVRFHREAVNQILFQHDLILFPSLSCKLLLDILQSSCKDWCFSLGCAAGASKLKTCKIDILSTGYRCPVYSSLKSWKRCPVMSFIWIPLKCPDFMCFFPDILLLCALQAWNSACSACSCRGTAYRGNSRNLAHHPWVCLGARFWTCRHYEVSPIVNVSMHLRNLASIASPWPLLSHQASNMLGMQWIHDGRMRKGRTWKNIVVLLAIGLKIMVAQCPEATTDSCTATVHGRAETAGRNGKLQKLQKLQLRPFLKILTYFDIFWHFFGILWSILWSVFDSPCWFCSYGLKRSQFAGRPVV